MLLVRPVTAHFINNIVSISVKKRRCSLSRRLHGSSCFTLITRRTRTFGISLSLPFFLYWLVPPCITCRPTLPPRAKMLYFHVFTWKKKKKRVASRRSSVDSPRSPRASRTDKCDNNSVLQNDRNSRSYPDNETSDRDRPPRFILSRATPSITREPCSAFNLLPAPLSVNVKT